MPNRNLLRAVAAASGCVTAFAFAYALADDKPWEPRDAAGAPAPTYSSVSAPVAAIVSTPYAVVAWNDLGMHCIDGKDYSLMSILPPYNNLHAHVINRSTGKHVSSGVTLTYEAAADPDQSINTGSASKTNFWSYVQGLYGANPQPDRGLNLNDPSLSNPTPSRTPAPMKYNASRGWYEAEGLPITPYDDSGKKNFYPMVKLVARDSAGRDLGNTVTVLPVSDELTCIACHASNSNHDAAKPPRQGWADDKSDVEKDWKKNVLRLHDDKHVNDQVYKAALARLGNAGSGLAPRAAAGNPVLCASCHGSNALNSPGYTLSVGGSSVKVSALTSAMHRLHARVTDPTQNLTLDAINNRASCYLCHPGAVTKCLRGAMSEVAGLDCQSCHGNHTAVGAAARSGWLQEPNCQSCHHDGRRDTSAVTNLMTGALRQVTDTRFATNPNVPATGISLFRFSVGHGKSQCESCHGSTHAEYSSVISVRQSSHENDILESKALQGYVGPIQECGVCHQRVPLTATGGPHGMHTIGQAWVNAHGDMVESSGPSACQYCHDARDANGRFLNAYRGTVLSKVKVTKTFNADERTVTLQAGTPVGCYDCHRGPRGD